MALAAAALALLAGCPSQSSTPVAKPTVVGNKIEDRLPVVKPAPLPQGTRARLNELIVAMYIDDIDVRRDAAEELGHLGADAREALPELINCAGAASNADEPRDACAHSIVVIASGHVPVAMDALVAAFRIPLAEKEAAVPTIGELGGLATPALATLYLDACERMQTVSTPDAQNHLATTRQLMLKELARAPASAIEFFEREDSGACGLQGADALRG